jgi:hypothetical protein
MFDLKANFFNGRSFHSVSGPVLVPIGVAMVAITVACFYLNTVFGFAIGRPGTPQVRPGFAQAWHRRSPIIAWGIAIGTPFAISTLVVARITGPWFVLILGIVVGVMMILFLAVPARLVGAQPAQSRRDKVATTALGGVLSAIVCTPPYLLGRLGILMLGTSVLFIPGIILLTVGFALEAGATAAVRAIKLSAKLISRDPPASGAR